MSVYLSIFLSVCLPSYLSVCLPSCLSVSVYLSAYLSVCLYVCLFFCLCSCLSICLVVSFPAAVKEKFTSSPSSSGLSSVSLTVFWRRHSCHLITDTHTHTHTHTPRIPNCPASVYISIFLSLSPSFSLFLVVPSVCVFSWNLLQRSGEKRK